MTYGITKLRSLNQKIISILCFNHNPSGRSIPGKMNSKDKLFNFLANIFSIRSLKSYLRKRIKEIILYDYLVYGDEARLHIAKTAVVNNALFNLSSGNVVIEDWVFFGHHVSVLTGTHDYQKFGRERQMATEATGRDVVIEEGVWIASNVTIIGLH